MTTAGPNSPGTIVSDATIGTQVWTDPGNAAASDDSRAVAAGLGAANTTSEYLLVTNFGFSIPGGATIDGITVALERSATQASRVNTNEVKIVKGGVIGSENKADGAAWPTTEASLNYGGVADLWSETWSVADINASNFGVVIGASATASGTRDAQVDHVTITVDYTEGGGGGGQPPRTMHQVHMRSN
jgi:hypothetical protein